MGAIQTFICDPGECVRECLREVKRQRGRKIVSKEEIISVGYKFFRTSLANCIRHASVSMRPQRETHRGSHSGRETYVENETRSE